MKKVIKVVLSIMLICALVGCISTPTNFKADFVESKRVTIDFSDDTKEMLLLFFDCSNETEHTISPMNGVDIGAFQNGVALEFYTLYDLEEMGDAVSCDTDIQSGAKATVVWFFELRDDSPVSVEIGNGETFTIEVK